MKRARLWMALVPAVMLAWAAAAWAAAAPDEVCLAGKEVAAGEYGECRLRAEAILVLNDRFADYEKAIAECDERLIEKFALLESQAVQAGGTCPTVGDAAAMLALVTTHTNEIVGMLTGLGMPAVCGNGVLEPGEECEWGVRGVDPEGGVANCHSATGGWFPAGELGCNPGCTFDTSDCYWHCGGVEFEGHCWILGEDHEPCNGVCGKHDAFYDPATAALDGAGCNAVLTALGVSTELPFGEGAWPFDVRPFDYGLGCGVYGEAWEPQYRALITDPPTTATACTSEWRPFRRACACARSEEM